MVQFFLLQYYSFLYILLVCTHTNSSNVTRKEPLNILLGHCSSLSPPFERVFLLPPFRYCTNLLTHFIFMPWT